MAAQAEKSAGQNPAYRPSGAEFHRARHILPPTDWRDWKAPTKLKGSMARPTRSNDWGFPRWRGYGSRRETVQTRPCDRHGCDKPGNHPAPKAPNRPERWYFCEAHAAEYNRRWNYFEGLSAEEAVAREADETRGADGFSRSSYYGWGGPGDGTRSRDEMHALSVLEVDADASFTEIRSAYRRLAKANHPDTSPDDAEAATRFQAVQAAYEVLRKAEERRNGAERQPPA